MKNPLNYFKHIVKDPIKTIAEADARKKEIMPLFYGSVGVIVISVILQIAVELDFMSIFSFIGLVGAGFCGFLFMVINKAKTRFQALTCDKCNTLAEIKTPEEFARYISYTVEKDEAKFHGYTGNKQPTDGVYSQVKYSGSASSVLSVALTCPHCGEVKHLRFSADTFRCHAEASKVGALQFAAVSASLEAAVKAAVDDYNDPGKKGSIPYTFHSSKNPNFEKRYSFKGANGAGARSEYRGAIIDYHKDVEEILEHYFVFNELTGTLVDPNADSKKNTKPQSAPPRAQTDAPAQPEETVKGDLAASQPEETVKSHLAASQPDEPLACEPETAKEKEAVVPVVVTNETPSHEPPVVVPQTKEKEKPERKGIDKRVAVIVAVCAVLIVGGVIIGVSLAGRDQEGEGNASNPTTESTSQQGGTVSTTTTTAPEKLNVHNYVGYWHVKDNSQKELTIHSGSSDSVNFSLWYSTTNALNNVSAQLKDNVASFSLAVEGSVIKGTLTFLKEAITVSITQSSLTAMPVEELKFTELHMSSQIPDEDEPAEDGGTNEDGSTDPSLPDDSVEETKPPMTETPYLFPAAENTYEIYKEPSYSSTYVKMLPKGTFTIVAEEYDAYNNLWGKLKSGVGWICVADNTGE